MGLFATTVIGKNEEAKDSNKSFFELFKRHDWGLLRAFHDWNAQKDNLEAYFLICPDARSQMWLVRSPQEFFDNNELFLREDLSSEEAAEIKQLLSEQAD
jgi:hypothetical protein